MFATPAAVLGVWFRGLLAIGVLVLSGWLAYRWYDSLPSVLVVDTQLEGAAHEERRLTPLVRVTSWRPAADRRTAMLAGAALLLCWSLLGARLNRRLFLRTDPEGVPSLGEGERHQLRRADGSQLHVEILGPADGMTVILTHGWGTSREEWAYLRREWGTAYRLIVWDLPGLGRSDPPKNGDFTLEKMAHDLKAVIELSGRKETILVGHSIGGMIILTFCKLFPQMLSSRVSRIAIVHSSYTNPLRTMKHAALMTALQRPLIVPLLYLQIALSPLVRIMNWLSYLNGSLHNSTARSGFAGTESRQQLDFVTRFTLQASPAVLARGSLGMLKYDATEVLKTIPVPVLVFAGDQDPVTLPQASQRIGRDVPEARLHTLSPGKHYGFIEHHTAFAKSAAAFCRPA